MQESGDTAGQYSDYAGEITGKRWFALALAASFAWHIFWLTSVKIFVPAPVAEERSQSAVSFIGSILEDSPIAPVKPSGGIASEAEIKRLQDLAIPPGISAAGVAPYGNEKLAGEAGIDVLKEIEAEFSVDTALGAKETPEKPFDRIMVSYKTYPSEIRGPARFREVIYKPELPASLKWDEGLGVDLDRMGNAFSIELKFRVSPEGKVESVERVSSSGHPTVDLIGIRYLKGWKFAPLKAGGREEEQWGTLKLDFSLNKAQQE